MTKTIPSLLLSIICFTANAQIIRVATTPTAITSQIPGYNEVAAIATKTISYTPSVPGIPPTPIDEDPATEDDRVYRYADVLPVSINMADGNITNTAIGKVWTLRISIPNALNIGFTCSQFDLPASAEMYVFNEDRTVLDSAIKKAHFPGTSRLSVFAMKGSSAIIYIVEPGNFSALQSTVAIPKVEAGFQPMETVGDVGGAAFRGPSINCNPMVKCENYRMESARAVARFASNGYGGTGTLLNNENQNGRAFFLTAFHIIDTGNDIIDPDEEAALANATFEFQFWRTTCNGSVNNRSIIFTGAALRASHSNSDVVLLELLNPPGVGDGVTYAGWNRQTSAPPNYGSYILHHPEGADMRVTSTRLVRNYLWNNNFWTAKYSSGTVTKGSSGSALFNPNGQVVGQLRGGWSSCNFTDFGDRYGKFDVSWNIAGLQTWLSPSNLSSITPLPLGTIEIEGEEYFACSGPDNVYAVPNLLGCTYTWTTSANLQITAGQNTPTLTVHNNSTLPYDLGWIEVQITDSKGRQRTVSARKNTQMGIPYFMQVIYKNYSGNDGYFCSSHTSNRFEVTPTGSNTSYMYRLRSLPNMTILYTSSQSYSVFPITVNYTPSAGWYLLEIKIISSCGESDWIGQEVEYVDCSSMGMAAKPADAFKFIASPNPAYGNLNVTIHDEKAETSSLRGNGNIQFTLYDFNQAAFVKQWNAADTQQQHILSLQGVKPGQYVLVVQKGKHRKSAQIIVK